METIIEQVLIDLEPILLTGMVAMGAFTLTVLYALKIHERFPCK